MARASLWLARSTVFLRGQSRPDDDEEPALTTYQSASVSEVTCLPYINIAALEKDTFSSEKRTPASSWGQPVSPCQMGIFLHALRGQTNTLRRVKFHQEGLTSTFCCAKNQGANVDFEQDASERKIFQDERAAGMPGGQYVSSSSFAP